ncbi:hypothetical protein RIF29_39575 [Crotalaria pallida]|uniref:Ysc84 actin-binding domain-containing protein n=1 Tax=Crotalaria pallida TaxID=3830 RepID=A0AAN9E200_CROPI
MARGRRHLHPLSISHLPYLPHSHHYTDENRGGHRYQPLRLSWQITPLPSLNVEDRYREDNIWVRTIVLGASAAAGPVGRVLEADIRAGDRGSGMCYTYSCSKGAFVGVSLEGNVVATRMDTNLRFYGDPYLTTSDILLGMVDRPKAAQPLYTSLKELYSSLRY